MNAKKRFPLLSVLAFAALLFCFATTRAERPPFKIYTTQEGLAHDSVHKIVRDSRGFLWFCTAEGLSRFDGATFKNFTQDQGLPHRSINDFFETADGIYLVATNSGLAIFNPNGRAYRWNVIKSKPEINSNEPPLFQTFFPATDNRQKKLITAIGQDRAGKIWIGTDYGIFRFVKTGADDWRLEQILIDGKTDEVFSVLAFLNAQNGDFLMAASNGVFKITEDEKFVRLDENGAAAIMQDLDGRIWLDSGTKALGLRVFDYENGAFSLYRTYTKKDGLPENAFYFALKQTSDGRIFVGQHDGLSEFVPDAEENEPSFRVLRTEKVTTIEEDAGGNLWVGSELKGAWKLAGKGLTIFGEADGIGATDDIRAIYETLDGKIVLPARPLKSLLYRDGKFVSVAPLEMKKRSWSWHFLDLLSKDGEWWIPTEQGLIRYPKVKDLTDLEHTPPKKVYTTADGLPGNEVFNIFEDSRGDIWMTIVGAENSLLRWERKTDRIIPTTDADNLPKFNGPLSFVEDADGNLWFGFYFGGLARYRDGKFEYFTAKDGIPESQILDLLIDDERRLWIATSGQGLYRLDNTNAAAPDFKNISTVNGLSSSQVICLTKDAAGRIYAGTGRGINRIDKSGGIRIFSQADGLPSNYITRCRTDRSGVLWFVSQNTLIKFAPENEPREVSTPVFIDKISVNGVAQKISALGETEINLPELASDQRQIQIDFFALTFGAGENIRYQYRLDEQDWSSPSDQQTLNLNLGAGEHNFEVRAVRTDGATSEKSATVSFRILPPIYARWWFIALSVSAIGLTIFSIYRYRTANLRAINKALTEAKLAEENLRRSREERLAELEKVRSRIATDLHDDIGASLTQIAILSEVARQQAKNGNGAIAKPLKEISSVSNELVGTMSDIVWSINPTKDHFSDVAQRMRRFASDVLSAKNINLQFHAPRDDDRITINSNVRREVFLIFKESINNIVKHSGARRASINVEISGADLLLEISDDGNGFSLDLNDDEPITLGLGGNGIPSMTRRAEEMGGAFEIVSEPGKGTIVKLRLPLENAAAQTGGDGKI